jgi:hypothetical protein
MPYFTRYRALGMMEKYFKKGKAHPFEWTKQILHPGHLKQSYADLCN